MGHNLWLHFGVDEHPFTTCVDVHQGYRVLTHSQVSENPTSKGAAASRRSSSRRRRSLALAAGVGFGPPDLQLRLPSSDLKLF